MKYFEPNLIKETQKLINNNNLLILTFENNEKLLKLENYYLSKSIDLNIIGTCNVVKACKAKNIKIIYKI